MKATATINGMGLTEGKEYEVLEKSAGYFKVRLDNGNVSYRREDMFEIERREQGKK